MVKKIKIREACSINESTYSPKENWKFIRLN